MGNSVQHINKIKTGTCPHGLAPGVCPVCSSSGGGLKQSDRTRRLGEMTYHECAMIGAMLKARALAQKHHTQNLVHQAEIARLFENQMTKMHEVLQKFVLEISDNVVLKPIKIVVLNVIIPAINFLQSFPAKISTFINKIIEIKNQIFEIADKLSAIYGEIKNFIDKKVSELISSIKSKINNFFKIFKKHNTDDDDTKIDDDKRIFNFKKIFSKLLKKDKNDNSKDKQ